MQSTLPHVFFGGDAAFGPKNIIWAVAHGHEAAVSIDKLLHGEDVRERPDPMVQLDLAEDGHPRVELRQRRSRRTSATRCRGRRRRRRSTACKVEVELGFDAADRVEGSAALPQLRRADGVHARQVHRVRRLRRHLPDGLHHLHRQRRRGPICARADGAGAERRRRICTCPSR